MRYGMLVFAICMLCVPFVLAESGSTGLAHASSRISLPDISGSVFTAPASLSPSGGFTQIAYYVRKSTNKVIKGVMPVTGGQVNITDTDILIFTFQAKYTGPAGSIGMIDLYNYGGSYPLNGTPRVDAAITIPAGSSGTLTSPPYWFNWGNNGLKHFTLEFWGNQTGIAVPVTINVLV